MTRLIILTFVIYLLLSASCSNEHLILDKSYRQQVERDFKLRKELARKREAELFSPFKEKLTTKEKEALQFLFAYMPLSDLADHSGDFFLANARYALTALEESGWNDSIPDHVFLHYVLPPRVNNENLDSFRIAYYKEIRQRLR
ncbi:MAG: hypothetical protein MUD02_10050 [Bacteroidales bacterium]|nr:hypothetical protein [Bacteroidales bacterium]